MPRTAAAALRATSSERRVLEALTPALHEARDRGQSVLVDHLRTFLSQRDMVRLAARLCLHEEAKLAVLPSPSGRGVIFVPV